MNKKLKAIILSTTVILILTGCNVEQTINDAIDGVGGMVNSGDADESAKRNVYEDAKEIIKKNLLSPSSATFPTFGSDGVEIEAISISPLTQVKGYVDSDNGMGTSVRTYYTVSIFYEEYAGIGQYTYEIQELG